MLGHHQDLAGVIAGAIIGSAAILAMMIVIPVVLLVISIKRGTVKWKGKPSYI